MGCPVCAGSDLPGDVSVVKKRGERIILQGVIYAVIGPTEAHYSPFSDYFTVSLYPRRRKDRVKYLKFKTQEELKKWGFARGKRIRCEGCLHEADGKEIVFDVTKVEFL
jgi:hypothetical protein